MCEEKSSDSWTAWMKNNLHILFQKDDDSFDILFQNMMQLWIWSISNRIVLRPVKMFEMLPVRDTAVALDGIIINYLFRLLHFFQILLSMFVKPNENASSMQCNKDKYSDIQ